MIQEIGLERKSGAKRCKLRFSKKPTKDSMEKEIPSISTGGPSLNVSHGLLSRLKTQALFTPRAKHRMAQELLREKVFSFVV